MVHHQAAVSPNFLLISHVPHLASCPVLKKKKNQSFVCVFSSFSFALLFTRISNPQQLLRQTAQPLSRRTQAVSLSEQTPALT